MHKFLILVVGLTCGSVLAGPGGGSGGGGSGRGGGGGAGGASEHQSGSNVSSGHHGASSDAVESACRARGLSDSDVEVLTAVLRSAEKENLPVGSLCAKLQEGLVKQVPVGLIVQAAEKRLGCLREANQFLENLKRQGARGRGPAHMVEDLGVVLEGGLPIAVFEAVFARQETVRMGRIAPIIDAAEVLQLAGLRPDQVQQVLGELSEREMSRREVGQVVAELRQSVEKGLDFDAVFPLLWEAEK